MKNIILLIALSAATYYAYNNYYLDSASEVSQHSLSDIQNNPIPKDSLFDLWHVTALKMCNGATESFNITQSQCLTKIESKKESCKVSEGRSAPAVIESEYEAKKLGKAYLLCAVPGYHCNGIEVKSEEEARRYCQ